MSSRYPHRSFPHASLALATNTSDAFFGLFQYFLAMLTASWLLRCSHTPSLARMTNLSLSPTVCLMISGVGMTPTQFKFVSPIARLTANPPTCCFTAHTLAGPTNLPPIARLGSTCPRIRMMRSISSFRSGLWSLERSTALKSLPSNLASTALESPTFAVIKSDPWRKQLTVVEPLSRQSIPLCFRSLAVFSNAHFKAESADSDFSRRWNSPWESRSFTNPETSFPCIPWPSITAAKKSFDFMPCSSAAFLKLLYR
mmetsp:Transcript_1956/g.3356  ORF Transcript_1956/g.3356 Transcript_1956/m.3356 type:complete len:256 (+) Transcript_1956:341-1108(+)